jgi:hypothetical protein
VPTSEAKTYEYKNEKFDGLFKIFSWISISFVLVAFEWNICNSHHHFYRLFTCQTFCSARQSWPSPCQFALQYKMADNVQYGSPKRSCHLTGFMISVLGNLVLNLITNQSYKNTNKLQMKTTENVRITERLSRFPSVSGYRPVGH